MKLMEFILRTSVDMNSKDKYGWTALHAACYNRKTKNFLPRLFKLNNYLIWDDDESTNRKTETAQLIIQNSNDFGIDLNARDKDGFTAWQLACWSGHTETAQMILKNSKEFGIDVNDKHKLDESTALHLACFNGETEIVQMILDNWKEFGIDIKARDKFNNTALDTISVLNIINDEEEFDEIKKMLEKEYSQIDVTES